MMGSMFGAYAPPQGGGDMFGQQQQQSPLMQMLGGGAGGGGGMNPQLMQLAQQLMSAGGPQRLPAGGVGMQGMQSPMMGAAPMGMGMGRPPGMGMGQSQMGLPQLLQLLGGSR